MSFMVFSETEDSEQQLLTVNETESVNRELSEYELMNPIYNQLKSLKREQKRTFRLVSRSQKRRGHFNVERSHIPFLQRFFAFRDTYHFLLGVRWYKLFAICFMIYVLIHLFFGFLYYLGGKEGLENSNKHSYWNCVFFSVQTFSTIGYGKIYPSSNYTNVIVSLESFVALFIECFMISLVIGKFTRPTLLKRKIIFSKVAVVNNCDYEGNMDPNYRYISFRMISTQKAHFVDAHFRLLLLAWSYEDELTAHNEKHSSIVDSKRTSSLYSKIFSFHDKEDSKKTQPLKSCVYELDFQINVQKGLARGIDHASPILPIPWTIKHKIDSTSPLYDIMNDAKRLENVELIAIYDAIDEATSHNIQARYSYTKCEIFMNAAFKDCVFRDKNKFNIDMKLFDAIQPCTYSDR